MFIITWSQKLLCSCKGHQNGTWHHGFATIVIMTTCSIFKYVITFEFILIYLNDLKLIIKKYHLFLQLITTNNDSISKDDDVTCHVSTKCYK
jgi:hypothetical protein